MAALTQQQWYEKIKTWVPSWFISSQQYNAAVFQAMAKLLASADSEMRAQLDETFITRAAEFALDQHGYERGILRYPDESDNDYSERIRNLANVLTPNSVEILTNIFLLVGTCTLIEHEIEGFFFDQDEFFNRKVICSDIHYNTFTILISYQGNDPEAQTALDSISATINASKALGTLYRIVELNY